MLCRALEAIVSKQEWEAALVELRGWGGAPGFPKGVTGLFEYFYGTAGDWLTLVSDYF